MRKQACRTITLVIVGFLCLSLWMPYSLSALDPDKKINQYAIKTWDMEDGLPGNAVYAIEQTNDGYIWLGTVDGLIRYNARKFEPFHKGQSQLKDEIRALFEDSSGALWIGTETGGLFRYQKGDPSRVSIQSIHPAPEEIRAINQDCDETVWIGSKNGLFYYNKTKNKLEKQQGSYEIRSINKDKDKTLWMAEAKGVHYIKEGGSIEQCLLPEEINKLLDGDRKILTCLYEPKKDKLWISISKAGLFCVKKDE